MNTKPLTIEEVTEAADIFFPIYEYVKGRLPADTKVEDVLKVAENVCTFGTETSCRKRSRNSTFWIQ